MHRLLVIGVAALATLTLCGPGAAWTWPADGQVLRPFGMGTDPYAGGQHRGIDVAGPDGSTIRAPAAGTVTFAGSLPTHGRGVTIQTDDGYAVTLVHLGTIGVEKGAVVAEGDPIGAMGSSGAPEHPVPSVHLGIRRSSDAEGYVDPLGLLPPRAVPVPTSGPATTPAPSASPVAQPVVPSAPPGASPPPAAAPPQPAAPTASPPAASPVPEASPLPAVPSTTSSPVPDAASPGAVDSARAASSAPASTPLGTSAGAVAAAGVAIVPPPPGVAAGRMVSRPAAGTGRGGAPLAGRRDVRAGLVAVAARKSGTASTSPLSEVRTTADPRVGSTSNRPTPSRPPVARPRALRPERGSTSSAAASPAASAVAMPITGRPNTVVSATPPPARDLVRTVPGGAVSLGPIVAAFVLGCILAVAGIRRAARRIDSDGALLPHDADLLRELDPPHRARVHDRGGGHLHAPPAAARP